ncbi:MAG: hypothetical protein JWN04_2770, partial [Myxococcaceae bacterium]|nr:hypothetical protein [Myxococcaceae bacterium]
QSELAEADLLVLRGRASDAVELYASIFAVQVLENPFQLMSLSLYARALRETGRAELARAFCEENLARLAASGDLSRLHAFRQLIQQLALAEAQLGWCESARTRLDEQLAIAVQPDPNPLTLGSLERDRARVAIVAKDDYAFEHSLAEMKRWFNATRNPWLLQQCDALVASAERTGLRAAQFQPGPLTHVVDDLDGSTGVDLEETQAAKHNAVRASLPAAESLPSEPPPRTARG